MTLEYRLRIFRDIKEIIFKYVETHYPLMDTGVVRYHTHKLNIMLSDGLAAVLNDRNDIYNTFSGDLLFFGPAEIHHGRILRQGIHRYIEILLPTEYFPSCEAYNALFNDASPERTNLLSPAAPDRAEILALAEKILCKLRDPASCSDSVLFADLIALLETCSRLYRQRNTGQNSPNIPPTLQTAIAFIRREYADKIQLSDIAAAANCSTSYLSRIFRRYMGKSPYGYLQEYRLFVAERLLRNGSSVTEAAFASGFSDSSVFIRCFKRSFGLTPLQYRFSSLHPEPSSAAGNRL